MPFSDYALDRFVSQEMSQLTECKTREVGSSFPDKEHWVSSFVLNSIFRSPRTPEATRFAFLFLRRAEAAFVEYENACDAMSDYVTCAQARVKKPSLYFRALHHFEMTIAMLWQAYTATRSFSGKEIYEKGQNSQYERLNNLYNNSRYFNPALPSDHLHRIWITNEGINTEITTKEGIKRCSVSFEELKDFLEDVGRGANVVSSCYGDLAQEEHVNE